MVRLTDRPAMTIAVDLGRKATKQTKTSELRVILAPRNLFKPSNKSIY